MKFEPKDTVVVVQNRCNSNHPTEKRKLEPGDKIVVLREESGFWTAEDNVYRWAVLYEVEGRACTNYANPKNQEGVIPNYKNCNFILSSDVKLHCICESFMLSVAGCQCGVFKREQQEIVA